MSNDAKFIMGFIVFYFLVYHVLPFLFDYYVFKRELKKQKTGPPRAYYEPLRKPTFFNKQKLRV